MRVHSEVGIITNSSSEIFTFIHRDNGVAIGKLLNALGVTGNVEIKENPKFREEAQALIDEYINEEWAWQYRQANEHLQNGNLEDAYYYLAYEGCPVPYIVSVNGKDITDILCGCVSAEDCGNGN